MKDVQLRELHRNTDAYADAEITVRGWVRTNRNSNKFGFIELNDGSFFKSVQVVYEADKIDFDKMKKSELIAFLQQLMTPPGEQTALYEKAPQRSDLHPTMKPIKLITRLMTNSSKKGWLVLDPFAGSGTTLITAEMTGRVARCIELDPYYCDVIVRRYMATFETDNIKCLRNGRILAAEDIERIYQEG